MSREPIFQNPSLKAVFVDQTLTSIFIFVYLFIHLLCLLLEHTAGWFIVRWCRCIVKL